MTKTLKELNPNRGIQLDASFDSHRLDCASCGRFDAQKPATAALMCLEGSVLYKRDNPSVKPRPRVERDEHYATKGEVKRVTRYRGE